MKFSADHTFRGIELEAYESLHFDEEFQDALCVSVKLSRACEKLEENDGHISRAVRVGPDREIPPAAQRVLGGRKLDYTEHLEYQRGSWKGTWRTEPSLMPDKVHCKGTIEFLEVPGGVRRLVHGEIKVKLFGVGGMVEKLIVSDVVKSYDKAASFTQRWIDSGGKL